MLKFPNWEGLLKLWIAVRFAGGKSDVFTAIDRARKPSGLGRLEVCGLGITTLVIT